jgi:AcrR family transcriptional regulator
MDTEIKSRRTKKVLDEAIWNALERLIVAKGFNQISLVKLAQEAAIEPPVIYNRFTDIGELFEKYIRKYDFWIRGIVAFSEEKTLKENVKTTLVNLINDLYDNEIMQKILVWELNDTHTITRKMAMTRDFDYINLMESLSAEFTNEDYRFDAVTALIISGIYYLILHRKIAPFNSINFNTQQGKELLIDTVEKIIDALYPDNSEKQTIRNIAEKLLKKGVDKNIIQESTGLSAEEMEAMGSK